MRWLLLLLFTIPTSGADYYVCSHMTASGDGSAASPWKAFANVGWATVQTALNSGNVTLHVCSRGTFAVGAVIGATAANTLKLDGCTQWSTNAATGDWSVESAGQRAVINSSGFYLNSGTSNAVIYGFELNASMVANNNTGWETNINFITVSNCYFHDVVYGGPSIAFSYMTTNCHHFTIAGNTISNSHNEAVYVGRFDYMLNTVSNVVVEYNRVVNCGDSGDGAINIKPPCTGAIVRYNTHTNTADYALASANGITIYCDGARVYGNTLARMQENGVDWGWGIYVNADGDGVGNGHRIDSCLIYNNLIYANDRAGIQVGATTTTADANIAGLQIFNNTFVGNGVAGLQMGCSEGRTITAVMTNNLFFDNTNNVVAGATHEVVVGTGVTLGANNNLYYRGAGALFSVGGADKTWAQWRALNYDVNGVNADPLLNANYTLTASSPAKDAGATLSTIFTTDLTGATRSAPWDMGAYEYGSGSSPVPCTATVGTLRVR